MLYACLGRVAGLTFRQVRRRPHVLRAVATDADLEKALQAKSPFLREFASRGYLAQCTDIEGLDEKLTEGRVSACVEINQCVGRTDNSLLSHFSATTWPRWLSRRRVDGVEVMIEPRRVATI